MPRLRNVNSGVVVSVDDETAARLDAEWVPAEEAGTAPTKRARPKKTED